MSGAASPSGIVVNWGPREILVLETATQTVRRFELDENLPYGGKTATLAISRKSIFVRAARVPNAAPEEIRLVVQVKLAELFPLPPTDLAYDFLLLADVNSEGRLALIMAMPVNELRRAHEKLNASGIKIARTLPLALGSSLVAESMGLHDAAVVESEGDFASIDLVSGGILRYSRVVPQGIPIEVEVNRTGNAAGLAISEIIVAGASDIKTNGRHTSFTSLQAIAGSGGDKLKVNIELPEVIAKRELAARRNRTMFAACLLVVSLAVAFYVWTGWAKDQSAVAQQQDHIKKLADADKKYVDSATSRQKQQDGIWKVLQVAFQPAQTLSDVSTIAANCVPSGVWLSGISAERGKEITLRGTAMTNKDVSDYVAALTDYADPDSGQPRFRNVQLVGVNDAQIEKQPVVNFSISAFPIGNLPIALQQKAGSGSSTQ